MAALTNLSARGIDLASFLALAVVASVLRGGLEVVTHSGQLAGWQGGIVDQAVGYGLLVLPFHIVVGLPIALVLTRVARRWRIRRGWLVFASATVGAGLEAAVILLPSAPRIDRWLLEAVLAEPLWVVFALIAPLPDHPGAVRSWRGR